MSRYVITYFLLLVASGILSSAIVFVFSNHNVYAHTFSQDEGALLLTLIHKIQAELQIVKTDILSGNSASAQQHVSLAADLLNQNNPSSNLTWTEETKLISDLNTLKYATKAGPNATTPISNNMQTRITNINDLLSEAVSARISKDMVNNPKIQALIISNLGNEIYNSYGKAFGIEPAVIGNIGTITMDTEGHGNISNSSNSSVSNNNISRIQHIISSNDTLSRSKVVNITAYQTAQALAGQALETFNKNLKPITPSNATAANSEIEKDLIQIKSAIDDKGAFMDIANLVHIQLHPTLITTYGLRLK